ncbi:MAG: hypothetical protein H0V56_06985 [Chthoniobacterales bacterium]|nr:hypothetical protein [Chthoniobacterales bacterium]
MPLTEEAAELQRVLHEWENITSVLIATLHEQVDSARPANWHPHFEQIVSALHGYRELCRREIEQIGLWREDGLEPEEVHEQIWEQGDRLAKWLSRMIGT